MRFESKHRFFKRVVRYTLNFINVTKSLSIKHELLQSLIRLGSDLRVKLEIYNTNNFQINLFNTGIHEAIKNAGLAQQFQQCNKVTIKGTEYKQGQVLVLRQDGYRYNITMRKSSMFLYYKEDIYVLFEILTTEFIPYLNVYKIGKNTHYECQRLYNIVDYKPLYIYDTGSMLCVKP